MNERLNRRDALRRLLNWFSLGMAALAGAVVSVPILAYLLSPLLQPAKNVWRTIAPVDSFTVDQFKLISLTDPSPLPWSGQTALTAAWAKRSAQDQFTVFAVNCTHLGCPVSWEEGAQLFFCPCHGGVYYSDGTVAGGPPPRRLIKYEWRIQNGNLQVKTQRLPIV